MYLVILQRKTKNKVLCIFSESICRLNNISIISELFLDAWRQSHETICVSKADTQCTQLLMNSFCFHSNQLHLSDAVFSDALQVNASAAHNACFFVSPPPPSLKAHGAGRYQANTCPRVNGFSKLCEMTHFYTHMSSSSALVVASEEHFFCVMFSLGQLFEKKKRRSLYWQ